MGKVLMVALRFVAVCLALLLSFVAGTVASGLAAQAAPQVQPAPPALPALLLFCACVSSVVTYLILRSRRSGWRLVGAIFLGMYGLMTVLSQLESIIYLPQRLPAGMIPRLFVMGLIASILFAPLAVLVLGRLRRAAGPSPPPTAMPWRTWIWRSALVGLVYVALYMTFGYYVAWKNPAVRQYYGGIDPGSFPAQMLLIWRTTPWMFPFQWLRGVLWMLFLLPLIRMLGRSPAESARAMALFSGVWSTILLLPNPYMPEGVARAHFVETLFSNLLFGAVVGWLAVRPAAAAAPASAA